MFRFPVVLPSAVKTVVSENGSAEVPAWLTPVPVCLITYWPFRLALLKPPPRGGMIGFPLEPQPTIKRTLVIAARTMSTRLAHLVETMGFIRHSCLFLKMRYPGL